MSFALPVALWGLALLPVVVLLRLLARRPRTLVVPSLIPWRNAAGASLADRRRSVLFDLQLILQLIAVAAAVLAAARPQIVKRASGARGVAIVIENSASMAAGGRMRDARERLGREIEGLGTDLSGAVWVTSPRPRMVAGPGVDRSRLLEAIGLVEATGAGGDLAGAIGGARRAAGADAVLLVAADDAGAAGRRADRELVLVRVGEPARNLGIVAAAVEEEKVFCAVRSASAGRERVTVSMGVGGKVLDRQEKELAPGARGGFTFDAPGGAAGFITLSLGPDDLAADNVARLSARPAPRPAVLKAPGRSTARTEKALAALGFPAPLAVSSGKPPPDARLIVACGLWPKKVPTGGFVITIDPPAGELAGVKAGEKAGPATARLGLGDADYFRHAGGFELNIDVARELDAGIGGKKLLADGDRPLVALSADGSACVLAFDPEKTKWVKHPSFPVFFARLAENVPVLRAMRRVYYRTGERVPGALGGRVTAPGGRTVGPGELLDEAGLYRVNGEAAFAANLLNEEETACRVAGREVRRLRPPGEERVEKRTSLTAWFFALALVALAAEWFLVWRGRAGRG